MKCECGNELNGARSIEVYDSYVYIIRECLTCERRMHQTFLLSNTSVFLDTDLEKSY